MQLRAEQLGAHLSAPPGGSLSACYLFSGDEQLLVNEALDALRAAALRQGCDERESFTVERGFDWSTLVGSLSMRSLFSAGKLIVLRLPTAAPGDEGSRALREIAARPPDGNVVAVVTPKLSGKIAASAWVKALKKDGVVVELRPLSNAELPRWIAGRLKAVRLSCDAEGAGAAGGPRRRQSHGRTAGDRQAQPAVSRWRAVECGADPGGGCGWSALRCLSAG